MINIPINLAESGLITLFLWVLTGALGIPGSTIGIIIFGSLVTKISSLIQIIIIVYIAVVIGDIIAYELSSFFSKKFRKKLRKLSFFKDNEKKVKKLLEKYEFSIIFFTRFALTGLCQVTSYVCGFEKINRKKFITAVLIGELLFAILYSLVGFAVGTSLNILIKMVNNLAIAILLLLIAAYLAAYQIRKMRKKK
ncbi:MAG: VTT domain-containing protein [Patescibacteria group bacterium]